VGGSEHEAPEPTRKSPDPKASAVDERMLLSGTTLRFVQMMLLMLVATVGLASGALVKFEDSKGVIGCELAAGIDLKDYNTPGRILAIEPQQAAFDACVAAHDTEPVIWPVLVWPTGLLLGTGLLFLALPRWRTRGGRLSALHLVDEDGAMSGRIAELSRRAGLPKSPTVVVDSRSAVANAVVFGSNRRPIVRLDSAMSVLFRRDRKAFDAVLLHELAHIRGRDVTVTYLSVAMWRVFVLLVAIPFVVLEFVSLPGRLNSPAAEIELVLFARTVALAIVASALVFFARNEVLWSREFSADRMAARWGADVASLERAWQDRRRKRTGRARGAVGGRARRLVRRLVLPVARRLARLWRTHPAPSSRRANLDDPAPLFGVRPALTFTTGMGAVLISAQLESLAIDQEISTQASDVGRSVLAAALITGVVGVGLLRHCVYAALKGRNGPSFVREGLWLGAGMIAGEAVASRVTDLGWLSARPAVMLVLLGIAIGWCWWCGQTARLWIRAWSGRSFAVPFALALTGGGLVLTAALNWWQSLGVLLTAGLTMDPGAVADSVRTTLGPLDGREALLLADSTVMLTSWLIVKDPLMWIGMAAAWIVPAAALIVGANPRRRWIARARRTDERGPLPSLRHGGLAVLIGVAVATGVFLTVLAWLHAQDPPSDGDGDRGLELLTAGASTPVALVLGAVTAAVLASRVARFRLVTAMIAAQAAVWVGFGVLLAIAAGDGCLPGLSIVNARCEGGARTVLWPVMSMTLQPALAAALVAAAVIAGLFAARARYLGAAAKPFVAQPETGRSGAFARRAATGLGALVLGAVVAVEVPQLATVTDPYADAEIGALLVAPETEPDRALQMAAWVDLAGGRELIDGYLELFEELPTLVGTDAEILEGGQALLWFCADLQALTARAQAHLRIPDPDVQQSWEQALTRIGDGADSCVYAFGQRNDALIARALEDLVAGVIALTDTAEQIYAVLAGEGP